MLLFLLPLIAFADDFADTPDFAHAMDIRTEKVDGFPVVFHYGEMRPDFEDRLENPYRQRLSLDGAWAFRFDPENLGRVSDAAWTEVTVPHCWDMMPGGRFWDWTDRSEKNPPMYDGAVWYQRDFDFEPIAGKRHRLEFLGIPHRVRVYLNGTLLARHEGEGQPFSIDVTAALKSGSNQLAVQIIRLPNFTVKPDGKGFQQIEYVHTRHPKAPDNWPYGGIPRSVSLLTEHPVSIAKTQIRTSGGRLEAAVCISNHGDVPVQGEVEIGSDAISASAAKPFQLQAGGNAVIRFSAPLNPEAAQWSPETPVVHNLKTTLKLDGETQDQLRSDFGIREFRTEGNTFTLNGKNVFLKGVAFYEEHHEHGNALTRQDHEAMFKLAKDADANFIRLHVGERHPWTYQLADRQGMMLCAEWGGFWYKEKSMGAQTEDPQSIFQSLARCALWDLMNHPSVVMWGLHNESHQFCSEYEEFVKLGHELVDGHDWQQRPVTWAAWHPTQGEPHFEHADAVGFNEYRGAMDPFEELDPDMRKVAARNPGKPLIILENGGWAKLGKRGDKLRKGTEDWQADLLQRQYDVLKQHMPPLSGYTYWLLMDYRSRKTYTGNQRSNGWSGMGMYSALGEPKLVRDVFKGLW
ncbi:MAG: sugar-binding domain-containing protein [Luteolibacter sp.]